MRVVLLCSLVFGCARPSTAIPDAGPVPTLEERTAGFAGALDRDLPFEQRLTLYEQSFESLKNDRRDALRPALLAVWTSVLNDAVLLRESRATLLRFSGEARAQVRCELDRCAAWNKFLLDVEASAAQDREAELVTLSENLEHLDQGSREWRLSLIETAIAKSRADPLVEKRLLPVTLTAWRALLRESSKSTFALEVFFRLREPLPCDCSAWEDFLAETRRTLDEELVTAKRLKLPQYAWFITQARRALDGQSPEVVVPPTVAADDEEGQAAIAQSLVGAEVAHAMKRRSDPTVTERYLHYLRVGGAASRAAGWFNALYGVDVTQPGWRALDD